MKPLFSLVLATMLCLPLVAFTQTAQKPETGAPAAGAAPGTPAASPQYGQGGSPHCDRMTGQERAQCLKDEGAKTDSKGPSDAPAAGATAPAGKSAERPAKKSTY